MIPEHGAIFLNHKPRVMGLQVWLPSSLGEGLNLRQEIIWARAGGINSSPTYYMPTHERILLFAKNEFRLRDCSASAMGDVWYVPQEENLLHPAPYPEEIPARAIETILAETILDPFLGSGTTAVAAKKLGRHFLGFEISPEYCKIAEDRIALVEMQPQPFAPKAEQLRFLPIRSGRE